MPVVGFDPETQPVPIPETVAPRPTIVAPPTTTTTATPTSTRGTPARTAPSSRPQEAWLTDSDFKAWWLNQPGGGGKTKKWLPNDPEWVRAVNPFFREQYQTFLNSRRAETPTPSGGGGGGGGGRGGGGGGGGGRVPSASTSTGRAVGRIPPNPNVPFPGAQIAVGQDPLSVSINQKIGDLLETGLGERGASLFDTLNEIIQQGGGLDEETQNLRFESARELLEKGRRTNMNQIRANLASRGLLSEPGIPQGQEVSAVGRLEERLGADFARELRNIVADQQQAADTRLVSALATASGLATTEARTILDVIGAGTERQRVLSDIALQTLDRNIAWNQFLAEFGLNRDTTLELLQSGRLDDVVQIAQLFAEWFSLAQRGQPAPA